MIMYGLDSSNRKEICYIIDTLNKVLQPSIIRNVMFIGELEVNGIYPDFYKLLEIREKYIKYTIDSLGVPYEEARNFFDDNLPRVTRKNNLNIDIIIKYKNQLIGNLYELNLLYDICDQFRKNQTDIVNQINYAVSHLLNSLWRYGIHITTEKDGRIEAFKIENNKDKSKEYLKSSWNKSIEQYIKDYKLHMGESDVIFDYFKYTLKKL